ncbi:DNA recombination protein RmuC [bacterium]|nr:DNA recombination protein RmuC [bacterium]
MIAEILLIVIVLLLLLLIFLIHRGRHGRIETRDIESAISKAWRESGLDEKVGELTTQARDIRESHRSIEQMLRVPKERASLGELSLETILSDQLPPDMFGIRERILDGKTPDASIKSTVGLICIDSKFPLDNYRKMIETEESKEKENSKKQFIRDVQGHLDKISADYVCPEKGSAEFAFAYIPSEGVYYFLVNEAYQMLRDYTRKGVQVVSPLTLSHKIELIKAGVHAKKLSQDAEKVRKNLLRLSQRFNRIDEIWRVFYNSHFKNLEGKAEELDEAYKKLREEFDRISKIPEE